MSTRYEQEWQRQKERTDVPEGHLPVFRWYMEMDASPDQAALTAPADNVTIMRAKNPGVAFYRFLYHTAGGAYLWADRRRLSDDQLLPLISGEYIHVMVLYCDGVPAGFFELNVKDLPTINVNYFALLPGFTGKGLGSYMLKQCIQTCSLLGADRITIDTCTLDHPIALENYLKRGFTITHGEDEIYPDPRLDGTVPADSGQHLPI